MLKRFEVFAKNSLALLIGLLLFRPGRKAHAQRTLAQAKRVLLVRIDNRVGEALLTTPLLTALTGRGYHVSVLCHPKVARVLEGHPSGAKVIPWYGQKLWLGRWAPEVRTLREEKFEGVVDCSNWTDPSVTSALVAQLVAGSAPVIGPAAFPTRALREVPISPRRDTRSEVLQRLHLLSPLLGEPQAPPLSFRPTRSSEEIRNFLQSLPGPFAVVNPGGRLGIRRIDPATFGAAAQVLNQAGITPVITFGPKEEALAEAVERSCPQAVRAPHTDLDQLAELMRQALLVVCNNTGPMHLAVAVRTPTLAFFLRMEMERWGHHQSPHKMVDLTADQQTGHSAQAAAASVQDFVDSLPRGSA